MVTIIAPPKKVMNTEENTELGEAPLRAKILYKFLYKVRVMHRKRGPQKSQFRSYAPLVSLNLGLITK